MTMSSQMPALVRAGLVALVFSAIGCGPPAPKKPMTAAEMMAADPLPMSKGSKWTYAVTVRRFDAFADKETTKTLTWVTEVIDARENNGVIAYRVKGWPSDLADFDAVTPVATEKTILRHGNSFLFGTSVEPITDDAEGWFSWPIMDGQKICPSAETVYCWQVASIEGGYRLSYHTGPDEQSFEIEPGTGISKYHYEHHGTTNKVEAKLVSHTVGRGGR